MIWLGLVLFLLFNGVGIYFVVRNTIRNAKASKLQRKSSMSEEVTASILSGDFEFVASKEVPEGEVWFVDPNTGKVVHKIVNIKDQ